MIRVNATVEDAVDERKRNGLEVGGGMKGVFSCPNCAHPKKHCAM